MDELDRLFALLVAALAREARVAVPFAAAEIYERLVPYRSNRARLNVATHQDYEMTVLRLLAGERGYVQLEPADVRDALVTEAAATNPDPAYFRSFPDARVMVNGRAAERVITGDRAFAPSPPHPLPQAASGPDDDELSDATGENPVPFPVFRPPADEADDEEEARDKASPTRCEYCGGVLPANREARFCPRCGQPQEGQLACQGCGAELDVGWAYCLSCGRATGFE